MNSENKEDQVAIVFGVGPGLGLSLANCFANAGMKVGLAARQTEKLSTWSSEMSNMGLQAEAFDCDVTSEANVNETFAKIIKDFGTPDLVVYNAGAFMPADVIDIKTEDFEHCWRVGCLGGFFVGREAARLMSGQGSGSIIFTGATASLRGSARFANLAVGKFGLRALAQSMARELGPKGIHIAHVIIDGQIQSERYAELAKERPEDGLLNPDAIADNYLQLHMQHRSAWTLELDLRPWTEKF